MEKFFLYNYNNLGIHAVIIYFCFMIIDLINGFYKNCLYTGFCVDCFPLKLLLLV